MKNITSQWGVKKRVTMDYQFVTCSGKMIHTWRLNAKAGSLSYDMLSLGNSKREYVCIAFSKDEEKELIVGTKSADFFVINMKTRALCDAIPIGTLGVTSVAAIDSTNIVVGCGSG